MLCLVLVASLALGNGGGAPPDAWSVASNLVFGSPIEAFIAEADSPGHDARLDWSSDGCSAPVLGSTGRSFDFTFACRRHDFAYRNLGRLQGGRRWGPALRERVDRRFLADMREHCARRPRIDRTPCRGWANIFYSVVRGLSGP